MSLLKRIAESILFAGLIFLVFCLVFENRIQVPVWLQVAGRMHPLFLHFPIVFLLLYLVALWLPGSAADNRVEALGLVAALSAVITAIFGFILALEAALEGDTFLWHKWGGVALAFTAAGFYYMRGLLSRSKLLSRSLSLAAALLLLLTGHWGANLTHGENYLLEPLASAKGPVPFDAAYAFTDVVQPVLQDKCGSCHSARNKKGGLALDDTTSVLEGGKSGALFSAGRPDSSLLLLRILLPVEHKKHMAPANKPQLTEDEIQLLTLWIKAGAPLQKKVVDLPTADSFRWAAARYLAPPETNGTQAYTFAHAPGASINALNTDYRRVAPVGAGSPALTVAFYGRSGYSEKALEELMPVKDQITDLSLAKLPVTDTALRFVQQFSNLEKLNLNYTDVTDRGIRQLVGLKKLKELALSGTGVTFQALDALTQLPELSAVYIWNTTLDSLSLATLQERNGNIRFVTGYNSQKDTTVYTLTPPSIKTPEGIFERPAKLEIKHGVRGVTIRYTLDGTEPDSINSPKYDTPIPLDSSVTVRTKAYKQGWHSSSVAERIFIRKGLQADSATLITPADDAFNPKNANLLQDYQVGNASNIGTSKWIGYKDNPGVFLLTFNQPTPVTQLWVLLLKNIGYSIFPAERIELWGGLDANKLKLLTQARVAMPTGYDPPVVMPVKLFIPETSVRYLKVVVHPLRRIPGWHYNKNKPSLTLISEVVVN